MTHLLHIDASAHFGTSTSRAASAKLVADLAPTTVTRRDLTADPLPQITGDWADARLVAPEERTPHQNDLLTLSDTLVAELQAADTIIIGTPLYNFSGPASLKAWMDLVARPRVTFHYGENGPEGLLKGKRAIVTVASGGVPVGSEMDYLTPHLKHFLGFIGITDVTVVPAKEVVAEAA